MTECFIDIRKAVYWDISQQMSYSSEPYLNLILKMLGLYLYTCILLIGHKSRNTLSLLNKLTLQKKLQNYVTNNVFWGKNKLQQQQNKSNKKIYCRSWELNQRTLAPKAQALPLDHSVN